VGRAEGGPARTLTTKVMRSMTAKMLVAAPVWIVTGARMSVCARHVCGGKHARRVIRVMRSSVNAKPVFCFLCASLSTRRISTRVSTHEVKAEHDSDDDVRERGERQPEDDDRLELVELHERAHDPASNGGRDPRDCVRVSTQEGTQRQGAAHGTGRSSR
jgi:hypothetical protein